MAIFTNLITQKNDRLVVKHSRNFLKSYWLKTLSIAGNKIKKRDVITLPDGSHGEVLDVLLAGGHTVFKIKRLDDNKELYFDESKVTLKKRTEETSSRTF